MQKYVVLDKNVGETPLQRVETWRATQSPAFKDIPLAYAGRLDPMASGKLLVLIGEECKRQTDYHGLDKQYDFSVLLGVGSDTADVLGIVHANPPTTPIKTTTLNTIAKELTGSIELPYPHYSSKTVRGKPLHTWTIERRLDEITIPTKQSKIYSLKLIELETYNTDELCETALRNINSLPPVTDPKKSIGNDFRRPDVRASWQQLLEHYGNETWQVAHFSCIASSGTYMRTLAEVIAKQAGTTGLAFSIHRTTIGTYQPLIGRLGWWSRRYS